MRRWWNVSANRVRPRQYVSGTLRQIAAVSEWHLSGTSIQEYPADSTQINRAASLFMPAVVLYGQFYATAVLYECNATGYAKVYSSVRALSRETIV